jgi:hypothetical protein
LYSVIPSSDHPIGSFLCAASEFSADRECVNIGNYEKVQMSLNIHSLSKEQH